MGLKGSDQSSRPTFEVRPIDRFGSHPDGSGAILSVNPVARHVPRFNISLVETADNFPVS